MLDWLSNAVFINNEKSTATTRQQPNTPSNSKNDTPSSSFVWTPIQARDLPEKTGKVICDSWRSKPWSDTKGFSRNGKKSVFNGKEIHIHTFFIYATLLQATSGRNLQKIKQKLNKTLRLNSYYLKIVGFLYPSYHAIIKTFLKSVQKTSTSA